jgi:ubiquinone/menaquinone biosynthesis C-methylase UbiE
MSAGFSKRLSSGLYNAFMSEAAAARYVMGHNERERRRLALQAAILQPFTEHFFRRAGIASGMRVLDIGCGVGDVSLLAARLVGRTGSVTSLDFDSAALQILRERAAAEGLRNISCVEADVQRFDPDGKFDAIVGRHILIHTEDPLRVLKRCGEVLQPRGLAAFQEYDFQRIAPTYPGCPVFERVFSIFNSFFGAAVHANIGSRLFHLFSEAGFEHPDCRGEFPVDGGPASPHYEWIAEALRSILPRARMMNVPGAGEIDIDTLEDTLRQESRSGAGIPGPIMFSCFARKTALNQHQS